MSIKDDFITHLRDTGLQATSASKAGVSLRRIELMREEDPTFDEQVSDTLDVMIDRAEREAFRRAVEGYQKPVYHKGELVDYTTEYSDTLLSKILTARRPSVYGNKQEISTNGPISIKIAEFDPPDDLEFLE